MPTVSIPGKDIQFFFVDTGAPNNALNYTTLILVHGHTYHGAVFRKLLPLAAARSLRIVCINRREYPGSTPHTAEELRVYAEGSDQERATLVKEAGINLALAVDGIIQQCDLSPTGVALCGWSLGNAFVMAAMSSILSLPSESTKRLQSFIKTIIMWDPPSQALGIESPPNSYIPLYDQDIPSADRIPAFAKWTAEYFIHGDLSARNPDQLNYRHPDPSRKPTFHDMPFEELLTIVDFSVGDKCDTILTQAPFASILAMSANKALFDSEIRAAWKGTKVACMYGLATSGNIHTTIWEVERRVKEARGSTPITFRPIEGANHFIMWEDPSMTLDELIGCMNLKARL
ncbi:Alpha/Beta hydrolase protein [Mycena galopus ATCC 62051]|nr:Alpha/Beta hydrolase protein [Mycena galopus ATCC 62051]